MKTEQAHLGRDAALRRPWTARDPRTAQRAVPTTWLNLVCLDAPLVAIAWLWLFARTFQVPFQIGNALALFLTAWLIYLADRFADSSTLKPHLPRSLRQSFCLQHREIWSVMIALVAGFDAYVIWRTTSLQTFLVGAVVGLVAVLYLVANHPLGLIWRSLPAKELAIGILFCAGTMVALQPRLPLTPAFIFAVISFAALCSLNCISVAVWECELDRAQRKVSIATGRPNIARAVGKVCLVLALTALGLAIVFREASLVFGCISVSALLLTWLGASSDLKEGRFEITPAVSNRRSLGPDERTALADLVLLTPIALLLIGAL
jgi:hypothetical protein